MFLSRADTFIGELQWFAPNSYNSLLLRNVFLCHIFSISLSLRVIQRSDGKERRFRVRFSYDSNRLFFFLLITVIHFDDYYYNQLCSQFLPYFISFSSPEGGCTALRLSEFKVRMIRKRRYDR